MEIFGEYAVLKVGEFPACQHAAGVHGISCLCFQGVPVRCDGRYQYTVSRLKVFDQRTNFHNLGTALMPQDHVVALADGSLPQGMDVGGTDCDSQWFTDGVQRTEFRLWLFNPARFTDL